MRASDEVLANPDQYFNFAEQQRRESSGYHLTERFQELNERFEKKKEAAFAGVRPCWDFRRGAAMLSEVLREDNMDVFECSVECFQQNFHATERVLLPRLFAEIEADKLIRVIDYWLRGIPLTPPFLTILDGGRIGKRDGFHRIAAAIIVRATRLPFWSEAATTMNGVTRIVLPAS